MIDALVFPDTRAALADLIGGSVHFDPWSQQSLTVTAAYHLPADKYGTQLGPFPMAHIYGAPGGALGYIDRVDRRVVEIYAPGETAVNILESVVASICGAGIETPSGYLDSIECDVTPEEIPYQSETLNRATATLLVTTRPVS